MAYKRYADHMHERDEEAKKEKYLFEFPRGKPYEIINSGELFRVQKPAEEFDNLRRQKPFIA
jgi:hypothetical protein